VVTFTSFGGVIYVIPEFDLEESTFISGIYGDICYFFGLLIYYFLGFSRMGWICTFLDYFYLFK
jgi:hypothetical protein